MQNEEFRIEKASATTNSSFSILHSSFCIHQDHPPHELATATSVSLEAAGAAKQHRMARNPLAATRAAISARDSSPRCAPGGASPARMTLMKEGLHERSPQNTSAP